MRLLFAVFLLTCWNWRGAVASDRRRLVDLLLALPVVTALSHALFTNGDNFRYFLVVQPLVICAGVAGAWTVWRRSRDSA